MLTPLSCTRRKHRLHPPTGGGRDSMDSEERKDRISRRRMLRRIGAGAVVAWTTPVLTSIRTPAFAATGDCVICGPWDCTNPGPRCGRPHPGEPCFCALRVNNAGCICFSNDVGIPPGAPTCGSDADCTDPGPGQGPFCVEVQNCQFFGPTVCVARCPF